MVKQKQRVILGIDPGLAHTGWGVVLQHASKMSCLAYGCIETNASSPLELRLRKIYEQMSADKAQVQYMVKQVLGLDKVPSPDHSADALAAAICYATHALPGDVEREAGLS